MADYNPAPVAPNAKPRLLSIVLLPPETRDASDEGSERYATMRFPGSYEDAVDAALKAFGRHMVANAKPAEFEMLCSMRDNEGKLVWATFDAADWALVVEETAGKMLGIRQKGGRGKGGCAASSESAALDEDPFIVGNVGLTYGTFKNGTAEWSHVRVDNSSCYPGINRPKTYLEAIELITAVAGPRSFPDLKAVGPDLKFKFHKFTSSRNQKPTTDCWVDFPEEAYQHNGIWRLFAPKPFEILGFSLHGIFSP